MVIPMEITQAEIIQVEIIQAEITLVVMMEEKMILLIQALANN
jgi:hypothetical protein